MKYLLAIIAGISLLASGPGAQCAAHDSSELNGSLAKYESGLSIKLEASTTNPVTAGIFKVTPSGKDAFASYFDSSVEHPRADGFNPVDLGLMPMGAAAAIEIIAMFPPNVLSQNWFNINGVRCAALSSIQPNDISLAKFCE